VSLASRMSELLPWGQVLLAGRRGAGAGERDGGWDGMAVTGARVLGGRYALRGVLGSGGMATVWRATDQVLGREVAVKVLSPQFAADPGFLARFEREARHAAALSHPGLVTVFDSRMDGAEPFIVMELVTGRTLRQVLDEAGMLPSAMISYSPARPRMRCHRLRRSGHTHRWRWVCAHLGSASLGRRIWTLDSPDSPCRGGIFRRWSTPSAI
jgi:Protein kinase domain